MATICQHKTASFTAVVTCWNRSLHFFFHSFFLLDDHIRRKPDSYTSFYTLFKMCACLPIYKRKHKHLPLLLFELLNQCQHLLAFVIFHIYSTYIEASNKKQNRKRNQLLMPRCNQEVSWLRTINCCHNTKLQFAAFT